MPFGKWKDFEDCVRDFILQGKDEDSAKRICGALKARLEKENAALSLEGEIGLEKANLIHGKAIHPIKTYHPEEWPSVRVYLEEELKKAAASLVGAPLLLDHVHPVDGRVLDAKYDDGAIEYLAELNDEQVMNMIKNGAIKHCSVEYTWDNLERINGVAPKGIQFTGLALLKDFEPGDPWSTVQPWIDIIKRLKEYRLASTKEKAEQSNVGARENFLSPQSQAAQSVSSISMSKIEKPLGGAVIDPAGDFDRDVVRRGEILADLKQICYEKVPRYWGFGAYVQNCRLRDLIRRLENPNYQGAGEG